MKVSYLSFFIISFFIISCATKSIPSRDLANAKMAIAQADNKKVRVYTPRLLKKVRSKYKKLNLLIKEKRYEEAKFLAQEIQADSMLMQKKASLLELQKNVKLKEEKLKSLLLDENLSSRSSL